jgi:scyllo-inositol 2-dehydrogenase (NADP+)
VAKRDPIGVAILGLGRSGYGIHARWLSQQPARFRIVVVADLLAERRARAQREFGCQAVVDSRALLGREDIDLVVNALPSHLHPRVSAQVLRSGHHLVCEKPVAWKTADFDRVVAAARRARRRFVAFHQRRFSPSFEKVRSVISSGVLGEIVSINLAFNSFSRRWDWQTLQEFNGGNLLNTGPHVLDMALCLLDYQRPEKIFCAMRSANSAGDAEDHLKVLLRTRHQPVVDVEISSCAAYPTETFTINGSRGSLTGGADGLRWRYFDPERAPKLKLSRQPIPGPAYCREQLVFTKRSWRPRGRQADEFNYMCGQFYHQLYDALRTRAAVPIANRQVRVLVQVLEECRRQNRLIKLPAQGWPIPA